MAKHSSSLQTATLHGPARQSRATKLLLAGEGDVARSANCTAAWTKTSAAERVALLKKGEKQKSLQIQNFGHSSCLATSLTHTLLSPGWFEE